MLQSWLDVSGWLFECEGEELARLAYNRNVLEIGCYQGRSTCAMADRARHITVVDWFMGSPDDKLGSQDSKQLLANFKLNTALFRSKIEIRQMPARHFYKLENPHHFDFIFYDAGHSYDEVVAFFEWLTLHRFVGVVALHDYNKPGEFDGTLKAVDDFKKELPFELTGSLVSFTIEETHYAEPIEG